MERKESVKGSVSQMGTDAEVMPPSEDTDPGGRIWEMLQEEEPAE